MSLQFSSPANSGGIVELIDEICKTNSSTYPINSKVRDVNLGLDHILPIIFNSAGTWNFDDSNQTNYPIIKTNLVAGQRDYSFTTDQSGSLILDIYKVLVTDTTGTTNEIFPYDVQSQNDITTFTDGKNTTGVPTYYDKTSNGIFLDAIPSYNSTNGLIVYINREMTYFTASDTTKKPGFAGPFHEYLALFAAQKYAARNQLGIAGGILRSGARTGLISDIYEMEQSIGAYYGTRERDTDRRLIITKECNK